MISWQIYLEDADEFKSEAYSEFVPGAYNHLLKCVTHLQQIGQPGLVTKTTVVINVNPKNVICLKVE